MKRAITAATLIFVAAMLGGCPEAAPVVKTEQSEKAKRAADSIRFTENAEIDNIKRRLELTADPGKLGFILLMNEAGQPILYEGVKGKVTSGSKRLTEPDRLDGPALDKKVVRTAPSDEGTWGSSAEYIFYWNTEGVYRQWNGKYLYADQPIRLRVEPLIVTVTGQTAAKP